MVLNIRNLPNNKKVMFVHEEMKTNQEKAMKSGNGGASNTRMPRSESTFSMSANTNAPVYQVRTAISKLEAR